MRSCFGELATEVGDNVTDSDELVVRSSRSFHAIQRDSDVDTACQSGSRGSQEGLLAFQPSLLCSDLDRETR